MSASAAWLITVPEKVIVIDLRTRHTINTKRLCDPLIRAAAPRIFTSGPARKKALRPSASESLPPIWFRKRPATPVMPVLRARHRAVAVWSPADARVKSVTSDCSARTCWSTAWKIPKMRVLTARRLAFSGSAASAALASAGPCSFPFSFAGAAPSACFSMAPAQGRLAAQVEAQGQVAGSVAWQGHGGARRGGAGPRIPPRPP
mmetsp:Transcript_2072/g.6502  ORF Transcript_2072/g.6502 Transcript_2072/m.6502 type:complete len:204 (+) Transcript_2072:927-1538(+)